LSATGLLRRLVPTAVAAKAPPHTASPLQPRWRRSDYPDVTLSRAAAPTIGYCQLATQRHYSLFRRFLRREPS